jgi:AcrR family transcriptional regulator
MKKTLPETHIGQRGPVDHTIRDQIVDAANQHFSTYGYGKTTVSDLAIAIGFSKAYIYKFFDSKQAIGEVICSQCLGGIFEAITEALSKAKSPTEKFRILFKTIVAKSANLFFSDRKLYDIAAYSTTERWASIIVYEEKIMALLKQIILEGRQAGEFERKTPLDETCRAIFQVMQPFVNPVMLQLNLDSLPDGPNEAASLVLRSLAP